MALHHIHHELKLHMLAAMHASLRDGGSIILTDVFNKDETGARFTQAGLRGPEECGGYMTCVSEFVAAARHVGFTVDAGAQSLVEKGRNHQVEDELAQAIDNPHATMAINKAIWFMELQK